MAHFSQAKERPPIPDDRPGCGLVEPGQQGFNVPVHRGHQGPGVLGRRPDHRHPLPRRPLRVEPACFQVHEGPGQRREDLGRPPGRHMAVERRSHRHQDVPGQNQNGAVPTSRPARARSRRGPRIRRTVAATTRPSPAANIRTDKPTGRIGFGFQTCDGGQRRRQAEGPEPGTPDGKDPSSQHLQLTARRLAGPTSLGTSRVCALSQSSTMDHRVRFPGDDQGISLTKVGRACQAGSAQAFWTENHRRQQAQDPGCKLGLLPDRRHSAAGDAEDEGLAPIMAHGRSRAASRRRSR